MSYSQEQADLRTELETERANAADLEERLKTAEEFLRDMEYAKCEACLQWGHIENFCNESATFCIDCYDDAKYECPIEGCSYRSWLEGVECGEHEGVKLEPIKDMCNESKEIEKGPEVTE